RFPETKIGLRNLPERIGFERNEARRLTEGLARAPAHELIRLGKGLNRGQKVAMMVVAEGASINERIARHTSDLAQATSAVSNRVLKKQIKDLEAARPYVIEHNVDGEIKPTLNDEHVLRVYEKANEVALQRETAMREAGFEPSAERVSQPGRFYK